MSSTPEAKHIFLELGDVIKIIAPATTAINNKTFYVDYLDDTQAKLINTETLQERTMDIDEGSFTDENIENIELISRDQEEGYARQHELLPGHWVSIHFGGEVPTIINGEITGLEEDMIELTTYPEQQKIYIDFAYKGIPQDLPIETIIPFTPPKKYKEKSETSEFPEISASLEAQLGEEDETGEPGASLVRPDIDQQLKEDLLTADDIVFGETLEEITQLVPVAESKKRYAIETQTDDLLNELLSTIPSSERTKRVLNGIHTMIERYKQLRTLFSKMASDGEIQMPDTKGANFKPLVERLEKLNHKLYWLLPIVKNKHKIYDVSMDEEDEDSDITQTTLALAQTEIFDLEQQYKQNIIPDQENKYDFLYRSLQPLLTPFNEADNKTDVILQLPVAANIDSIVDNLENFYSSVFCRGRVEQQRFVIEKYNIGLSQLHLRDIRSHKLIADVIPLTPNDQMDLLGFMTLPEAAVLYSHVNLPATSILAKAQLNLLIFNYWSILTKTTSVNIKKIAEDHDPTVSLWEGEQDKYLSNFQALLFEQNQNFDDRAKNTYKNFLELMVPKTRLLFSLIKKYIRNNTSYLKIIEYLEPFLVYPDDITFKQYENIVSFMDENILSVKRNIIRYEKIYKAYIHNEYATIYLRHATTFKNTYLFATLQSHYIKKYIDSILEAYGLRQATTAEFIKRILIIDNARLFTSALAWGEWDLFLPVPIDDLIQNQMSVLSPPEEEDEPIECKNFVLAKFYLDIADLREDDDTTEVYFDTKYDETRYEIAEEFSDEQAQMQPDEFNTFLTSHLVTNVGLSQELASREATAMIHKKRKIREGDYAYLMNDDHQNIYYVRQGDKWVHSMELDGQKLTKSLFCNLQNSCLSIRKDCGNIQINTRKIKAQLLEQIMSQYNKEYHISSERLFDILKQRFIYNFEKIHQLKYVEWQNIIQYDLMHIDIGKLLEEREIITSPSALLRDMILSQNDFVKKQGDIIKFVRDKCRPAVVENEEDMNWFYCLDTNQRLLPTFYKVLADAYYANTYELTLSKVAARRGEKSDDGDKIVDKYSGYTIRMIEYDEGEGYDESGYKIVSRAVLEADIGDILMDMSFKEEKTAQSEDEEMITNIISALEKAMHISIGSERLFIIKSVSDKLNDYLPSRESYKSMLAAAQKRGRRLGSYNDVHDEALLYFTLGYLLITIQTSMPSIRTNKTFPGCVRSFRGYPIEELGDNSAMTYILCIALRMRSRTRPWQRLPRLTKSNTILITTKLVTKLKKLIEKEILPNPRVKTRITAKQQYLQKEVPTEHIPAAFNVKLWLTFLPPLYPIRITAIQRLPKVFENNLLQNIEDGSVEQFGKLAALLGRGIHYSLHIQELIQRVINKEELLLENLQHQPLIENACCNEGPRNTIRYFIDKEANIVVYNKRVRELENMYHDVIILTRPASIFDPRDTKLKYPSAPNIFSEKTIYKAFIRFCLYNTGLTLDERTHHICGANASEYKRSDSIETKIDIMKREGRDYSRGHFVQLMNIVNRKNIIDISLIPDLLTRRFIFEQTLKNVTFLERIKDTPLEQFVVLISEILDTFDPLLSPGEQGSAGRDALDNMTTYLNDTTLSMVEVTLKPFLNKGRDAEAAGDFIDRLDSWKLRGENIYMSREDETAVTIRNFIEINIVNILKIYPTIILNGINYQRAKIPQQWKLSSTHIYDIQHIIQNEYIDLHKFYDDEDIRPILRQIFLTTGDLLELLFLCPFFADLRITGEQDRRKTILNGSLLRKILKFFLVYSLTIYINVTIELQQNPTEVSAAAAAAAVSIEEQILQGRQEQIQEKMANLLNTYLMMMMRQKKNLNISNQEITQDVLKSKEKEKAKITKRLGELSQSARNVELIMKNHRLGKWNLGQTRALYEYDEEQYDKERHALEEDALVEMRLNNIDGVTERTRQIYKLDVLEEHYQDELQTTESNGIMAALADDDDFGERDGDEFS